MTKQDERQRLKRRLQEYAVELTAENRWYETIEVNQQILLMGEDSETYNRLGKAFIKQGRFAEAYDCYQKSLLLSPTNAIARKSLARIEIMLSRTGDETTETRIPPKEVDLRFFVTEAGKSALTNLVDVPRVDAVEMLMTGEKVFLTQHDGKVFVNNCEGHFIGRIEPKLGQRIYEMTEQGNQFEAAIVQCDTRQVRLMIREVYQAPELRGTISFPIKFSAISMYSHISSMRYDYDSEDLLEEEVLDVPDGDDEVFTSSDEEELGINQIEKDISDDDDNDD